MLVAGEMVFHDHQVAVERRAAMENEGTGAGSEGQGDSEGSS